MSLKEFTDQTMLSALKNADSILLCTHVSPDGDAIGSMLCMGSALSKLGKAVTMACQDCVPGRYAFLPGVGQIVTPDQLKGRAFDLAFALDAGDQKRIGDCAEAFFSAPLTMQIDHHGTNPEYAALNYVDFSAGATGCIVLRVLHALEAPVDLDMAVCLYAAISSDTGNFCFRNTDAEVFHAMAELMEAGLDIAPLARRLNLIREEKHVRLLGRALQTLYRFADGRATGMCLMRADYEAVGALPEHNEKIVNYGIDLEGVMITYRADEREEGITKVSLRAQPPCDVGAIAARLGGGGHALASGCTLNMHLIEACETIEQAIKEQLKGI